MFRAGRRFIGEVNRGEVLGIDRNFIYRVSNGKGRKGDRELLQFEVYTSLIYDEKASKLDHDSFEAESRRLTDEIIKAFKR